MGQMKYILAILLLFFLVPPAFNRAFAVEPATIVTVAVTASQLLQRDGGNPSLTVLEANRVLLAKIHKRLDLIEETMALALVEIAKVRRDLLTQNLIAQTAGIGSRITAIGDTYIDKMEGWEQDRLTHGVNSDLFAIISADVRDFLKDSIRELSVNTRDLMQRPNSSNVNALSVVVGAYLELAMRIELHRNFQASEGDVTVAAKRYVRNIESILDEELDTSLISMINQSNVAVTSGSPYEDWMKVSEDPETPRNGVEMHLGHYQTMCLFHTVSEPYQATCSEQVCQNSNVRGDEPICRDVVTECTRWRNVNHNINVVTVHLFKRDAPGGRALIDHHVVTRPLGGRFSCNGLRSTNVISTEVEENIRKEADLLTKRMNLVSQLLVIRDAAAEALQRIKKVAAKDFNEIATSDVNNILGLGLRDTALLVNDVDALENQRHTQVYYDAMAKQREKVRQLLIEQESQIQAAFDRAAEAAKWNRTLGYVRSAAILYKTYHEYTQDISKNDQKELIAKLTVVKDGIEQDMGRVPANAALLTALNDTLENVSFWGGLVNAKRQLDRLEAQKTEIQNLLPLGVTKEYDVVVVGTSFWSLQRSDQPQIRPGNARTITTIKINGNAQ